MPVWLESLFEFLFKYRPLVFARGHLTWSAGRLALLIALALGFLAIGAAVGYRRVGGRVRPRDRWTLLALRAAVAALLVAALLRPALLVSTAVPERNVVGILLDDSESMTIAEDGRTSRAATLQTLFGDPAGAIPAALADRFQLRWFRSAAGASRIPSPATLGFAGTRSDLGAALDDARRDLAALPLAGLVLVSDGADNADSSVTRALLALSGAGVPVYTVGIGADQLPNDLELARVEAPRSALRGASVLVEALVRQQGGGGERGGGGGGRDSAELVVEEEGRIVGTRRFALPGDGQATAVRLPVALQSAGPRELTVRLPPRPGETVTRNNERRTLVAVRDREERILYYEGEPRFEFAFLRRALAVDSNLRVVGLQRTAENKFLRLGVNDSLELIGGFPREREELFRYRGLILGSVEASAFTVDQLRMIADFVGRRGGGLLFLGGRRAFAEGGFRDTPLEDVLPVLIEEPADSAYLRELRVRLTPAGRGHPVAQLGETGPDAERRWDSLPPLTSVNRVAGLKPGATALLVGAGAERGAAQVVLATHRYGRGRAVALPVQDVWLWQMHADIPIEDQRFEAFWRQLLRWLTSEVPDRVVITALSDRVVPGEPVQVTVEVRDPTFHGVNGGAVTLRVTGPSGEVSDVPMEWTVGSDGQYRAAFPARQAGQYRVEAVVAGGPEEAEGGDAAATVRSEPAFVAAGDVGREFFGAERRSSLLRRIAEETGGRYYTAATAATLPSDIVYTERGITTTERLDLWDMPIVFLVLAGLLTAEWSLRRSRGLA